MHVQDDVGHAPNSRLRDTTGCLYRCTGASRWSAEQAGLGVGAKTLSRTPRPSALARGPVFFSRAWHAEEAGLGAFVSESPEWEILLAPVGVRLQYLCGEVLVHMHMTYIVVQTCPRDLVLFHIYPFFRMRRGNGISLQHVFT